MMPALMRVAAPVAGAVPISPSINWEMPLPSAVLGDGVILSGLLVRTVTVCGPDTLCDDPSRLPVNLRRLYTSMEHLNTSDVARADRMHGWPTSSHRWLLSSQSVDAMMYTFRMP